jgi:hypothetical protein
VRLLRVDVTIMYVCDPPCCCWLSWAGTGLMEATLLLVSTRPVQTCMKQGGEGGSRSSCARRDVLLISLKMLFIRQQQQQQQDNSEMA